MVKVDVTTPQGKILQVLADALESRDLSNLEPSLSKDFVLKAFPKAAELPDLSKEGYLQKYSVAITLFAKVEVRALRLGTASKPPADIHQSPGRFSRGD